MARIIKSRFPKQGERLFRHEVAKCRDALLLCYNWIERELTTRERRTEVIGTLLLIAAAGVLLYMWIEAHRNRIRRQMMYFETFPDAFDGLTIFFISDVHRRNIATQLLEEIDDQCDLVIIGGDFAEKGVAEKRIERNLKRLTALAPCYFIWGNNDLEIESEVWERLFRVYRVTALKNSGVKLRKGKESLFIAGVDEREEISEPVTDSSFYVEAEKERFSILVSHFPEFATNSQAVTPSRLF